MKFSNALLGAAAFTHGINAVAAPAADALALDNRAPEPEFEAQSERSTNEELWKRKGGGGGGGRGSGSSGSSGSSGGRGSSSGSSRPPPNSPTSNTGGRTTTGSGPPPTYGGNYYSGGARVPYGPGTTSGGIAPALLTGAALGGLGFVGYHYLYGAYSYPYTHHSYTFYNATTMMNETKPVVCLCDRYDPCTCEDNGDQAYFKSIVGNGTYDGLNMSIVTVAKNTKTGQSTIYINGGVPNGTTASGGTDDPNAASGMMALAQAAGWWPAAAVAFATAFML